MKIGDKVKYSPYIGCNESIKTIHTVTRAPEFLPNFGEEMVMLEGKSGLIFAEHCEIVK